MRVFWLAAWLSGSISHSYVKRSMNSALSASITVACLCTGLALCTTAAEPPQSVTELWADFDPRKDPLEVEVVREWKDGGGVYRYVIYSIGTFNGKPARMAAFYGFPEGSREKLPAVMHMHGGGQRAFLEEVKKS